ncbi:MAG: sulfatase-like hydrolase/transferase [Bacteroidales bacterium]|nr:sulfatase-like hydrolase/transferase [Bacteroidales bacterium]
MSNKLRSLELVKILFAGFVFGIVIQFNWGAGLLKEQGLTPFLSKHSLRLILSGLSGSLFFGLIYTVLTKFIFFRKNFDYPQLGRFLKSFNFLGLYLFFPPSNELFIVLCLLVPVWFTVEEHMLRLFKSPGLVPIYYLYLLILFCIFYKELLLIAYSNTSAIYYYYTTMVWTPLLLLVVPVLFPQITLFYSLIVGVVYILSAFIFNSHVILYGADMPASTYYAIWETTVTESKDFAKEYLSGSIIFLNSILFLAGGWFIYKIYKTHRQKEAPDFFRRIVLVSLLGLIFMNEKDAFSRNFPVKFVESYYKFKKDLKRFEKEFNFRKNHPLSKQADIQCTDSVEVFVLVIGESASKYHQGLYGYQRNTNPLLGSMKDELYIFDSIIAPHSHTNPVLAKVLSFANFENMELLYTKRSLIEYMKDAGYKTYWLSNQQFANEFNSLSTLIALQADERFFSNYNYIDSAGSVPIYDEVLLKPYAKALSENVPRKFIVIHLLGSHSDKSKRYPETYSKFNDTTGIPYRVYNRDWVYHVINTHDNSVLYTDYVLYQTIQMLKQTNQRSIWMYFSDHGEEIFDYRDFWGHSEANASIYMLDIPFILWFSPKYTRLHQQRVKEIKNYLQRKYQIDDVIHSIIDLTGCKSSDFDSSKSVFSPHFKYEKRYIYGHDYDSLILAGKKSITD